MTDPKLNILLLSAGRRVELAEAFKAGIASRHLDAKLYATDRCPELSAACHVVDRAFASPNVTDSSYLDYLLDLCITQDVGLVVPTIDIELMDLAQQRQRFAAHGIQLVISDEALVQDCRDKRRTARLFADIGVASPRIYERGTLRFPCFAKPYDGSRSIGAVFLRDATSMNDALQADPKLMFMEYIDRSHQEFTIDAYYDRTGALRCFVPRERLEVRDGEISKGATRRHYVYDYLRDRLTRIAGARGCLTIQLFARRVDSRFAALEINPRFGGGFPLSYAAGADYPGWLIDEYLLGRAVDPFDAWEANLLMLRYDAKVLVRGIV